VVAGCLINAAVVGPLSSFVVIAFAMAKYQMKV
jgi:hypothetical protein